MKKLTFAFTALFAIGVFSLAGCPKPKPDTTDDAAPTDTSGDGKGGHTHDHVHGAGPHGGVLADWGGGVYHVEFTVNHDDQQATVYILGDDEKTASPIAAEEIELSIKDPEMQVTLKAMPQQGDGEGKSSKFVGNHESLGVVQEYEGTITGVVDGTPYTGDFKEEPEE